MCNGDFRQPAAMSDEMNEYSVDTRIGRLEGRFDSLETNINRLHDDNRKFEDRQTEMLTKLDELVSERNIIVGMVTALAGSVGAGVSWVLTHWNAKP